MSRHRLLVIAVSALLAILLCLAAAHAFGWISKNDLVSFFVSAYGITNRENLTLLFAALAVMVTIAYGEVQRRGQKRDRRIAQEQLSLAHEQGDMRPKLQITEVRLAELNEVNGLYAEIKCFREAREQILEWERTEEEREEQEKREEEKRSPEEKRLRAEYKQLMHEVTRLNPSPPSTIPFSETPHGYTGPIPDKLLTITITNVGKTAAYEVTGWLRMEASHLQPVELFSPSADISQSEDIYIVSVGGTEKSTLMPTTIAKLCFRVAVAVHSPGPTKIEYEFTSPVGAGDKGCKILDIPTSGE